MNQRELNRDVAQATGETVETIARMGFSPADPYLAHFDPEPVDEVGKYIDWDQVDLARHSDVILPPVTAARRVA